MLSRGVFLREIVYFGDESNCQLEFKQQCRNNNFNGRGHALKARNNYKRVHPYKSSYYAE